MQVSAYPPAPRVGCPPGERRAKMFDGFAATPEQGRQAYALLAAMMSQRVDALVLNDRFRERAGLTDPQLVAVVQELQVTLFPDLFFDPGEYPTDARGHPVGLVPGWNALGVGAGRTAAAAGEFARVYADADAGRLTDRLVAEHRAMVERHRAERARMQAGLGDRRHDIEGGVAALAGKLRRPMTPERWRQGGPLVERIKKAAELWTEHGRTAAVARALGVSHLTANQDLKDAVRVGLLEGNAAGLPVRVTPAG